MTTQTANELCREHVVLRDQVVPAARAKYIAAKNRYECMARSCDRRFDPYGAEQAYVYDAAEELAAAETAERFAYEEYLNALAKEAQPSLFDFDAA